MRMHLSSYGIGNADPKEILNGGVKVALICNSRDYARSDVTEQERQAGDGAAAAELRKLGLQPTQIDLREYKNRETDLEATLRKYDFIWVVGGNTFVLMQAVRISGFDRVLTKLLKEDAVAYGGYSAGICLLGPTLKGLDIVDDAQAILLGETAPLGSWEGLGILSYTPLPHYKSNHPESSAVDASVDYFLRSGAPFRVMQDGDVITITNSGETFTPA